MTEHTQGQASDPDNYDARADGGILNTSAHSASSRTTLEGLTSVQSVLAGPTLTSRSGMSLSSRSDILRCSYHARVDIESWARAEMAKAAADPSAFERRLK